MKNICYHIAKQIREVHLGGNWTDVNLKDSLEGVTWQQSICQRDDLNTIALLVYHTNYYTRAVLGVLEGKPLTSNDKFSFDMPAINNADDWEQLKQQTWTDAERFASLVEALLPKKLSDTFTNEKYGTYFKNIQGIIEHIHYHLGQIVLIKKLLSHQNIK